MSVSSLPKGLYDDCKTQMLNKFAVAHEGVNILTCKEKKNQIYKHWNTINLERLDDTRARSVGVGSRATKKGENKLPQSLTDDVLLQDSWNSAVGPGQTPTDELVKSVEVSWQQDEGLQKAL